MRSKLLFSCLFILSIVFISCARSEKVYHVNLTKSATEANEAYEKGFYPEAINEYKRALTEYRLNKDKTGLLMCYERLAWLHNELGEYTQALNYIEKAIPLGKEVYGEVAELLSIRAEIYMHTGEIEMAEKIADESLAEIEDFEMPTLFLFPPSSTKISEYGRKIRARTHAHVVKALIRYFNGNYQEALALLEKGSVSIDRAKGVAEHGLYGNFYKPGPTFFMGYGHIYTLRGATLAELGKWEEAEKNFAKGEEAFKTANRYYGTLLNRTLYYRAKFVNKTRKAGAEEIADMEQFLSRLESFGASHLSWRMAFELGRYFDKQGDSDQAIKFWLRAAKILEHTRNSLKQDSLKQVFQASVRTVYEAIADYYWKQGNKGAAFAYIERARARAFLDLIASTEVARPKKISKKNLDTLETLNKKITDLQFAMSAGDKNEILSKQNEYKRAKLNRRMLINKMVSKNLAFASTQAVKTASLRKIQGSLDKETALLSFFLTDKFLYTFVVKNNSFWGERKDIDKKEIQLLVRDMRAGLRQQDEEFTKDINQKLSETLIHPISEKIANRGKLVIIPTGRLHYLPLSSLRNSENKPLVETHVLYTLPSASSITYIRSSKRVRRNVVALGNPKRTDGISSLPGAEAEARAIASIYPNTNIAIGAKATEGVVRKRKKRVGVLHFATHGKYDYREPLRSALLLAPGEESDGNLEAHEIFSMKLPSDIVVLSACESGIGKISKGDEVQGLNRAFLFAGAKATVSSLWKVSDEATSVFMKKFYRELRNNSAAKSLQLAQNHLRNSEKYRSPYYWSSFYLTGAP